MLTNPSTLSSGGNESLVCQDPFMITARGVAWDQGDPLEYSLTLFLLQVSLISLSYRALFFGLKFLQQPTVVCQILSGVVLGPSILGKFVGSELFPARGSMMLETAGTFGIAFFLFGVGVKMDPELMLQPGRKAVYVGLSLFVFTLSIPMAVAIFLTTALDLDKNLAHSLPFITGSQSLTSFPVIACLLTELKILNTEIGRLAVSSAMFCDFIGIALTAIVFALLENRGGPVRSAVMAIASTVIFVVIIIFVIGPLAYWVQKNTRFGKTADGSYMCVLFLVVLVFTLGSEVVGQHYTFGPFLLGFVMPEGPPMGAAVAMKLELLVDGILYPVYCAISGLQTNALVISFEAIWVVTFIILLSSLIKIGAVLLPALYIKMSMRDAFVLGLILNAKGIIEIVVYSLWRRNQILQEECYSLSILSVVIVTGIVTPLIRYLYNPSRQYVSLRRSTIQHTSLESELRILVCVHKQESAPAMINLLELSNPTQRTPLCVTALALVELVGRVTPILVAHRPNESVSGGSATSSSGRIINAFQNFQNNHQGRVKLQSFTSISHFKTIHDDICQLAVDQRSYIVIVPFHKEWAIDGSVGSVCPAIRQMNLKVLEKAPCSVAILVDRQTSDSSQSLLMNSGSLYRVGVIFVGGADDVEALAYGSRMAGHRNADVTIVRFLLFGSENSKERRHDSVLIDDYRRVNAGNRRFKYSEKLVRDGVGFGDAIRELESNFDLIMVGKHHHDSPLMAGLEQWSECAELGVVGDMLASPDLLTKVSVLVVQQQKTGGNIMNRAKQAAANERERGRERDDHARDFENSQRHAPVTSMAHHNNTESWTVPIHN